MMVSTRYHSFHHPHHHLPPYPPTYTYPDIRSPEVASTIARLEENLIMLRAEVLKLLAQTMELLKAAAVVVEEKNTAAEKELKPAAEERMKVTAVTAQEEPLKAAVVTAQEEPLKAVAAAEGEIEEAAEEEIEEDVVEKKMEVAELTAEFSQTKIPKMPKNPLNPPAHSYPAALPSPSTFLQPQTSLHYLRTQIPISSPPNSSPQQDRIPQQICKLSLSSILKVTEHPIKSSLGPKRDAIGAVT